MHLGLAVSVSPDMKHLLRSIFAVVLLGSSTARPQDIEISTHGSQLPARGSAQSFTGTATISPLFTERQPTRVSAGQVTFEPGARSAWHTHPAGQILIITSGTGWIQQWGRERHEIRAGDVVWIPPGVKHWHGATATDAMTHIAIQEKVDGRNVDWLEQVSDQQYRGAQ
jgi:quercetin dioxygenase-like cupin family protein